MSEEVTPNYSSGATLALDASEDALMRVEAFYAFLKSHVDKFEPLCRKLAVAKQSKLHDLEAKLLRKLNHEVLVCQSYAWRIFLQTPGRDLSCTC